MAKLAPKRLRCVRQLPDGRGRGIGKQSASQKAGGWSDGVHSSSEPCRSLAACGSRAFISMQLAPASRDEEGVERSREADGAALHIAPSPRGLSLLSQSCVIHISTNCIVTIQVSCPIVLQHETRNQDAVATLRACLGACDG